LRTPGEFGERLQFPQAEVQLEASRLDCLRHAWDLLTLLGHHILTVTEPNTNVYPGLPT
jgi:hypothetical protein